MKSETGRSKSLQQKMLIQYTCCVAVCFVISAPIFYLLTKNFYAEDMIDVINAVSRGDGIPPIDLETDIIVGMMFQFFFMFLVITASMFITIRFAARKLWRPFDDTLQKTEQFNLAQNDIPALENSDVEEFNRLNQSLELMMGRSKEAYRIQKEFTENASHELQTPLAIIRSKLDLLMQKPLDEGEMKLVSDLCQMTMRMSHLNRNLLLLAKIDNSQYASMQDVDVYAVLADTIPLYVVMRSDVNIKLMDKRACASAKVRANAVLLESLLKNLIVNAIRHTVSNGEISIEVADGSLAVSNRAINGVSLDSATLFCRFHRKGDDRNEMPSDNHCQSGNGLGLAIVKAICDYHHWTVSYVFESGCHRFIVDFLEK